jgi:hypothetical protein
VHQIELEMQNEDLLRTQHDLDTARARYFDLYLYDLVPVGYQVLDEDKGHIGVFINRHAGKEGFKGRQPTGRSADADDREVGFGWRCSYFDWLFFGSCGFSSGLKD